MKAVAIIIAALAAKAGIAYQELNRRQGEAAQKEIEVLQKVFNPSAKRSFNKTGFLNL